MRIVGLDILRGIAILLVLFRHGDYVFFLNKGGWIGVDLFFVLSGLLVAGLLFKEYKKKNTIDLKRFMIRRSVKIFSSFYFFTFTFIGINYLLTHEIHDFKRIMVELFYLQDYFRGINPHTWSLAIEEQFYIGLAIFAIVALKLQLLNKRTLVIASLTTAILAIFIVRAYQSYDYQEELYWGFILPHLRIDGILLGVLFSYCYYFTNFYIHLKKYIIPILLASILLVAPPFIWESGNYLLNAYGILAMNIGFAFIVIFSFDPSWYSRFTNNNLIKPFVKTICFIGLHSYNIYL